MLRRITAWNIDLSEDDAFPSRRTTSGFASRHDEFSRAIARTAVDEARELVQPVVYLRECAVQARGESRLFVGGYEVVGWPASCLRDAECVIAAACTIGPAVERRCRELMPSDSVAAVALDAVGSAALEQVTQEAEELIHAEGRSRGLEGMVRCYPGSMGWPTETAQPVVFSLLDLPSSTRPEVTLLPSLMMRPVKSLSLLMGLTRSVAESRSACDTCAARQACREGRSSQRSDHQ